jgi:hypothetical protein
MKTLVSDPKPENQIGTWQVISDIFPYNEPICRIDDSIYTYPPTGSTFVVLIERHPLKLSTLRGKMTKQSEKEIDDQFSDLRNEWDRNI